MGDTRASGVPRGDRAAVRAWGRRATARAPHVGRPRLATHAAPAPGYGEVVGVVVTALWIVAALALAWWVWSWMRPDPVVLAERAVRTGQLAPVLAALHRLRPAAQPTEYHRVVKRLWDGYHREEAVHVAKDLAVHHRDAPVAQYWLRQFLEHEPDIAKAHLDDAFLETSYDPAVAAKCGSYG